MSRVVHEGDVSIEGEAVAIAKSTKITGSMSIKGNSLWRGRLLSRVR